MFANFLLITRVVWYISNLIMKMRIYILKKGFYCFSKYSPAWFLHFVMRSSHLSKHFFHSDCDTSKTWFLNSSTAFSRYEYRLPRFFFLICWNKKKLLGAKSDSSSLVRFSNFCENFRQTNCGVPLRIERPTMLKWNTRHMTSFGEEIGDHLLQNASFPNNFRWIWLVFADPHGGLLCCFGWIEDRGFDPFLRQGFM